MFDIDFGGDVDPIRQSQLDLFGEVVVRSAKMHDGVFIDKARVNRAGWENVSVSERRETRLRKTGRRAVSTRQRFAANDNVFGSGDLGVGRMIDREETQIDTAD